MCSVGKRHVKGRMCCFSNHLFSSDSLGDMQERWTPDPWVLEKQSNTLNWDFKTKKIYFTAWKAPKTSVSFESAKHNAQCYKKVLPIYLLMFLWAFLFYVLFSLTKLSTILPLFFGDCMSWILESHRLEMSKCKTIIDLWDVMQSTPRCWFFSKS